MASNPMHIRFPTRPHNAEKDFIKSRRQRDSRQGDVIEATMRKSIAFTTSKQSNGLS